MQGDWPEKVLPDSVYELSRKICGCGWPPKAWRCVKALLERAAMDVHPRLPDEDDLGSDSVWFAEYLLDSMGLLEHGSNIEWAWLTDKGREMLEFLREHGCDWCESATIAWLGSDECLVNAPWENQDD